MSFLCRADPSGNKHFVFIFRRIITFSAHNTARISCVLFKKAPARVTRMRTTYSCLSTTPPPQTSYPDQGILFPNSVPSEYHNSRNRRKGLTMSHYFTNSVMQSP